jgi:DNA-binding LytR/AlgR family response regulator
MTIVIAEDEPLAAERLQALVKQTEPNAIVVAMLDSVEETVNYLQTNPAPDLLLLDIQLADGKSFRVLEQTKTTIPVIFTTAFDQYAIQAFKFHSIDYLLKPIQQHELEAAFGKLKKLHQAQTLSLQHVAALRQSFEEFSRRYKQRFVAKTGNKLVFVDIQDVAYFFADGKTVYVVSAKDGKKHIIDHSLEELENLVDPTQFFRISRKFVVKLTSISEIKGTHANMEVKLTTPANQTLSVSRERATEFKRWLNQ